MYLLNFRLLTSSKVTTDYLMIESLKRIKNMILETTIRCNNKLFIIFCLTR